MYSYCVIQLKGVLNELCKSGSLCVCREETKMVRDFIMFISLITTANLQNIIDKVEAQNFSLC